MSHTRKAPRAGIRRTGAQLTGASIPRDVMAYRRNRVAQLQAANNPPAPAPTDTTTDRSDNT